MDMTKNIGYAWYQCECCPYGYHIDLDFVRYCESMGQQVERSGSIKRRKDRRRQRQSMEVLLGLAQPLITNVRVEPPVLPTIKDSHRAPLIQDALNEVVSDFELTWQRSKNKRPHNLPDVTAVTVGDGPEERDFDIASNAESCSLSPTALQNIREQMALSLERTKILEEKVKMIPTLKEQVATLKKENINLQSQIRAHQLSANPIDIHRQLTSYAIPHTFDDDIRIQTTPLQQQPPPPKRATPSILMRDIGVGNQVPYTKSVATEMSPTTNIHVDRWFNEKSLFLNYNNNAATPTNALVKGIHAITQTPITLSKECVTQTNAPLKAINVITQTPITVGKDCVTQTNAPLKGKDAIAQTPIALGKECATQTLSTIKKSISIGINTSFTPNSDVVSADLVKNDSDPSIKMTAISLASLSLNRSKSFHVVEKTKNADKPVACACKKLQESTNYKSTYSQYDTIIKCNKGIQAENTICSHAKGTDTSGLGPVMKHAACDSIEFRVERIDFGCNTTTMPHEEISKKDDTVPASKIPRRQMPASPVDSRKLKRQNTYNIPTMTTMGISALELVTTSAEYKSTANSSSTDQTNVDVLPEVKTTSNIQISVPTEQDETQETALVSENPTHLPTSPRKKCVPSREMQAAMKVINDSLQKKLSRDPCGLLKNANSLVQTEWFSVSSAVTADPLDVEDYLDYFEEYSLDLLQYVVNTIDTSGNTAMHYAVSHGNFDVVSILLDSKVCDINKQNNAGYTSVMLVSLAEVRSGTHAHVVKRLFSLADVNNRAKLHGQTALMLAVSHGRLDMVGMLLEAGADINIQDDDGSTALMCAAEHGHVEIVKHFLNQADCDSSITDVDGSTALKIAMEACHRHIGVLLYAHERHLHVGSTSSLSTRPKINKSSSAAASPRTPLSSSPPLQRTSSHGGGKSQLFK